jgi:Tfp pilus assembly protein PilV
MGRMDTSMNDNTHTTSQRGITIIETMFAAFILVVGSLSMVGLIFQSIATNNRNKIESTQTMLATTISEQIDSTIIGSGTSSLVDCDGVSHTIDTNATIAGANVSGDAIDFTENIAADPTKNNFHMDYLLRTPCTTSGKLQGLYDVRWHVQIVGNTINDTHTYQLIIGARLKNHGEGNLFFSKPASIRVLSGN